MTKAEVDALVALIKADMGAGVAELTAGALHVFTIDSCASTTAFVGRLGCEARARSLFYRERCVPARDRSDMPAEARVDTEPGPTQFVIPASAPPTNQTTNRTAYTP